MKIERINSSEHLSELVELAMVEYGDSEIANFKYLKWQYDANPAGEAIVVVARGDAGELAGQYVVVPLMFRLKDQVVKGSLSLNTLIHPDFRGKGLFTKTALETYKVCEREGLSLTLGFPNNNSYHGFVKKLQFRHIGNGSVMFKPLRPLRILRGLSRFKGAAKYMPSSLPDRAHEDFFVKEGAIAIKRLDFHRQGVQFDEFVSKKRTAKFAVLKDSSFCGWRFQDHPTRQYQSYCASNEAGIQASCVVRKRKVKGFECVFIVDLQVNDDSNSSSAGLLLLRSVLNHYREVGSELAGILVNPGSSAHRISRAANFRGMPTKLLPHSAPIIVRCNDNKVDDSIFEVGEWDFSFGDYDVF